MGADNQKKVVLKVDVHDVKDKQKAMKVASSLIGIDSLSMEMKDRKMTVVGDIDPIEIVGKLRKFWQVEIVSVGPAKEPEKKGDPKTDTKKEEPKKDPNKQIAELVEAYKAYNPHLTTHYTVLSAEENPNSCSIM